MHGSTPFLGAMDTFVRLRRGAVSREVRISISTPLDEPDRIAPRRVLEAFLAGVETGLFGRARVTGERLSVRIHREAGVVVDTLEAGFSSIAPEAFSVLPSMVGLSVPGARRMDLREIYDDERVLTVRTLERDPEATILDVDWEISLPTSAVPFVVVEFREGAGPEAFVRLEHLFRAWAEAVALGAFPPADGSAQAATLREIVRSGDSAISARFEHLACGYDAFEALFEGVDRVHRDQPVVRLLFGDSAA